MTFSSRLGCSDNTIVEFSKGVKTQKFLRTDFNLTDGTARKDPREVCFGRQMILGVLED